MENVNTAKMKQFMKKLTKIEGMQGRVIIKHSLFGSQEFNIERLQPLVNEEQIGVFVRGHGLYIPCDDIVFVDEDDGVFILGSKNQMIKIICK